ncbi:MAG: DUF4349 domain-containing protein [Candidatus Pacebacteria bacterium]|nr:DUF4349 domain-containing protein [Candidatus Paceibacterota bacterium]
MEDIEQNSTKKNRHIVRWIVLAGIVFILIFIVLSSLNGARSKMSGVSSDNMAPMGASGVFDVMEESDRSYYESQKASTGNYDAGGDEIYNADERLLIKTGSLSLVVESVEGSAETITGLAEKYNGFVTDLDISDSQNQKKHGSLTVRVPSDSFNEVLKEVKAVASKITRELVNSQDVTEEYVDKKAEVVNLEAEEQQLLTVLKGADTIEEILQVRREISRVRGSIDRTQGRINYLERQTSMSTIHVSLVSESEAAVFGVVWDPLTKVKQAAYNMLESLILFVYFLIKLVFALPVIIAWTATIGTLVYIVYRVYRLVKRRIQVLRS